MMVIRLSPFGKNDQLHPNGNKSCGKVFNFLGEGRNLPPQGYVRNIVFGLQGNDEIVINMSMQRNQVSQQDQQDVMYYCIESRKRSMKKRCDVLQIIKKIDCVLNVLN